MKHEIIYTEHYLFIVSNEQIKERDWFFNGEDILQASRITDIIIDTQGQWSEIKSSKKIIAHRPLTNAPVLEEVPLLPEFGQEEDVEDLALAYSSSKGSVNPEAYSDKQVGLLHGFIDGYNKAKETYKYTEENLRECCSLIFNALGVGDDITTDEIIQHIQQPKRPKYFECEMEDYGQFDCGVFMKDGEEPKTITNSQGQTELVGEYIF